ncbi:aldehyde dehydrogenase [Nocardioides sp. S5]|uniref:aldehyde dehydrogenase family protein n=1 Tax=Nocardioides sp. S5 TaxID=2017486 RepID=UPI001A90ACC0|nr:aldehyde dehydrogenase family protein [Nocardioides sp. S5]QSR30261.1 aldehyde dehydrogenase [Nocardioides sp. S5]
MATPLGPNIADRSWHIVLNQERLSTEAQYDVEDPSSGRRLASVPDCSPSEVDQAVQAASAAQVEWGRLTPRDRAAKLRELVVVLRSHREELALLDAVDGGFPLAMMRVDVDAGLELMEIFADLALSLGGRTIPVSENLHYTAQQPYGVVARIGAFNHPFFFAAGKIAAPLIAGNAVILKAPDQTPLSSLRLAELASAVLPANLLVTVSGRGAVTGRALVRHPLVHRIGFIGSPETGRAIQRDAADVGVKNISLELGGKNAQIVFADADLEAAASAAVQGMNFTWTAGQSCGSTSRLLLHESIAEKVTTDVAQRVKSIRVGHPLDEGTQMGPLISEAQYLKTLGAIESGEAGGARVVAGGGRPDTVDGEGWYVAPTVLSDVDPTSSVGQDEIFGPVLSIMTFRDEDDAVRIANGVEYGLTSSIWTNDVKTAHRVAGAVDAGYILVNCPSRHFWGLPFGGIKSSGVGREESVEELISYTQTKTTTVAL